MVQASTVQRGGVLIKINYDEDLFALKKHSIPLSCMAGVALGHWRCPASKNVDRLIKRSVVGRNCKKPLFHTHILPTLPEDSVLNPVQRHRQFPPELRNNIPGPAQQIEYRQHGLAAGIDAA